MSLHHLYLYLSLASQVFLAVASMNHPHKAKLKE